MSDVLSSELTNVSLWMSSSPPHWLFPSSVCTGRRWKTRTGPKRKSRSPTTSLEQTGRNNQSTITTFHISYIQDQSGLTYNTHFEREHQRHSDWKPDDVERHKVANSTDLLLSCPPDNRSRHALRRFQEKSLWASSCSARAAKWLLSGTVLLRRLQKYGWRRTSAWHQPLCG